MRIDENIRRWAQETPKKVCLIYKNQQVTHSQLEHKVDTIAHRLATLVHKGDKVIVQLNHPIQQVIFLLAIARLGGASILLDPAVLPEKRQEMKKKTNAILVMDQDFSLPKDTAEHLPEVTSKEIFLGALSSGSTGDPKLIWRDHQSWTSAFTVQSQVFHLYSQDHLYVVGSLIYTGNLNSVIHMLHIGGTIIFGKNSFPRTWVQEILYHKVSAIFMVPTNYRILLKALKEPMNQITSLVSCGAKMDVSTAQELMRYFPLAHLSEYYGASELGHVSYASFYDLLKYPDSVGKVFPGVHLSIQKDLIWVKSPYLAPDFQPLTTVGDLGKINEEGYLFLMGRQGALINSGGIKIHPKEVEDVIRQCPGVSEAMVKGIEDPIRGQKVAAWVLKENSTLTQSKIRSFCSRHLPKHACPQKIFFIKELPLNISGKPDYKRLKLEDNIL